MPAAVAAAGRDRRRPGRARRCAGSGTWTQRTRSTRCSGAGPGLGVRRTDAARRARGCGPRSWASSVVPVRVDGFAPGRRRACAAAGLPARYLVAADGLHSRGPAGLRAGPGPRGAAMRRAVRAAPALPARAVDRPGRGVLGGAGEAYVTPVADDLVGIGACAALAGGCTGDLDAAPGRGVPGAARRAAARRARPAAGQRRCAARPAAAGRPAPGRGRVLLVGDASGYLDALTGEGIGVALAQAAVLAACLAARPARRLRAGLAAGLPQVAAAHRRACCGPGTSRCSARASCPPPQRLPRLFTAIVNQVADA